jgi:hypothetical protein
MSMTPLPSSGHAGSDVDSQGVVTQQLSQAAAECVIKAQSRASNASW